MIFDEEYLQKIFTEKQKIIDHLASYFDQMDFEPSSISSAIVQFLLDEVIEKPENAEEFLYIFTEYLVNWVKSFKDVD